MSSNTNPDGIGDAKAGDVPIEEQPSVASDFQDSDLPGGAEPGDPSLRASAERLSSQGGLRGRAQDGRTLAVTPLAVLLPALGDLSQLARFESNFEKRLQSLQLADRENFGEEELTKLRTAEESMLKQVLQWLSLGRAES